MVARGLSKLEDRNNDVWGSSKLENRVAPFVRRIWARMLVTDTVAVLAGVPT